MAIMSDIRIVVLVSILAIISGCKNQYKGGKVSEGTDAFVGFNVPLSDGTIQVEILNYLSGFRFAYDKDAEIECDYSVTNETHFAGIYDNFVVKNFKVKMTPVERDVSGTNECETVIQTE